MARKAMKGGHLDMSLIELLEPKEPSVFEGTGHNNFSKEDIIRMYFTLWGNFHKLKALYDELNVRTNIYEKKLTENAVDLAFDDEETVEYVNGAKSLIKSSSQIFKEQLERELGTYNDEVNNQITTQLNQAMISFKNQPEYSVMKVNHQIDLLEAQLEKTYNSRQIPIADKNRMIIALSAELRQQYSTKEKFMGRDINKSVHYSVTKGSTETTNSNTKIDWTEMKRGIIQTQDDEEIVVN